MSVGSEAAEQMTRESLMIMEFSAKLAASGAKNLAALLLAMAKDPSRLSGKTNLKRMIKEDRPIKVFQMKQEDLNAFLKESKRYKIPFSCVRDKTSNLCDILVRADDISRVNRILERMGYGQLDNKKNGNQQENGLDKSNNGLTQSAAADRPVHAKLAAMRQAVKKLTRKLAAKER